GHFRDHHCDCSDCCGLRPIMAFGGRLTLSLPQKRVAMTEKDHSSKLVPEKTAEPAKGPRRLSDSPPPSGLLSETTPSLAAGARPDVVVFKNVTKVFGHGPEVKVAIQDISFVVEDLP